MASDNSDITSDKTDGQLEPAESFTWDNPPKGSSPSLSNDQFSADSAPAIMHKSRLKRWLLVGGGLLGILLVIVLASAVLGAKPSVTHNVPASPVKPAPPSAIKRLGGNVVGAKTLTSGTYYVLEKGCALADKCHYDFATELVNGTVAESEIVDANSYYNFDMFDSLTGVVSFAPTETNDGLYLTRDGGQTWQPLALPYPVSATWEQRFLRSVASSGDRDNPTYSITMDYPDWTGSSQELIFESNDLGASWQLQS